MTVLDATADLSSGISLGLVWAAAIHLLAICIFHLHLELRMRRIRYLEELPVVAGALPSLSIVVAARNEERNIEEALRSLLALDYEPLEVIVVNDRSTDATGSILERISLDYPSLQILHLEELPENWLGKNHALEQGAIIAAGEYILFTDADVIFQPDSLQRAVAHADREQLGMLDHHAVAAPGVLYRNVCQCLCELFQALESTGPRQQGLCWRGCIQPCIGGGLPGSRHA